MKPNIVWISLESVRADYTSVGNPSLSSTPNLDRIADSDEGKSFQNCFAHARWTPASTTSILTGTYPSSHRVGYDSEGEDIQKVPRNLSTVPELLDDQGYRSALFGGNTYVSEATGLERGFGQCDTTSEKDLFTLRGARALGHLLWNAGYNGIGPRSDPAVFKDSFREWHQYLGFEHWLKAQTETDTPFFAYLHINNSHHPYRPPPALLKRVLDDDSLDLSEVIEANKEFSNNIWQFIAGAQTLDSEQKRVVFAAYEAAIQYDDYFVGKIFDRLQSHDNTILVVTGDHGELFGENGVYGHNLVLHDKVLHVPLVVHGLDLQDVPQDELIQHIDVMQTLLNTVGADTSQFQGYDLTTHQRKYILSERGPRGDNLKRLKDINPDCNTDQFHASALSCIRTHEWKYIQSEERTELYRLPDEETDVAAENREKQRELEEALKTERPEKTYAPAEQAEFDERMKEHLRDMGYI